MINQKILKGGETGETVYTLSEFAEKALEILKEKPSIDEVVILANAIKELKETHITPPRMIYPLPEGFEYRWSGFWGHVIGVMRRR